MKLNPAQKEAVEYCDGPLLIIAGAGSGKTRVITQKIVFLITKLQIKPEKILALTFTKKAASEMRQRVEKEIKPGNSNAWIGTIHSFCAEVLRANALISGLNPFFNLTNEADQLVLILKNLDKLELNYPMTSGNTKYVLSKILKTINRAKNENISIKEYKEFIKKKDEERFTKEEQRNQENIIKVFHFYQKLMTANYLLDFGDLVNLTIDLFKKNHGILKRYQKQFDYVLVDEFQDTNFAQNKLIYLLAGDKAKVCVVGDDDQSIYRFRGASAKNLIDFEEKFPKAKKIYLETNYRSFQQILDVAQLIIGKNKMRMLKVLKSYNDVSSFNSVHWYEAKDDKEEAEFIAKKIIETKQSNHGSYSDFAVLARSVRNHAVHIIDALKKYGIPVRVFGSSDFFQKKEVKDILAWIKILADPLDSPSLFRILDSKFIDIKRIDLAELTNGANIYHHRKLYRALENKNILNKLSSDGLDKVRFFLSLYNRLSKITNEKGLRHLIDELIYYKQWLQELENTNNKGKTDLFNNIRIFTDIIDEYIQKFPEENIYEFLRYLEIYIENHNKNIEQDVSSNDEAVNVLTVHNAKGLEFNHVFVISLTENRFPKKFNRDKWDLPYELVSAKENLQTGEAKELHQAEERRLFYVALTRARENIFLTYAQKYGQNKKVSRKSPFLNEIINGKSIKKAGLPDIEKTWPVKQLNCPENIDKLMDKKMILEKLANEYIKGDRERIIKLLGSYLGLELRILEQYLSARLKENQKETSNFNEKFSQDINLALDEKEFLRKRIMKRKIKEEKAKDLKFNLKDFALTVSSLNTYQKCPQQFRFSVIDKLPSKVNFPMSLGTVIHRVLEAFHENFKKEEAEEENIMQLLDQAWIYLKNSDPVIEKEYRPKWEIALKEYVKVFKESAGNPVNFEKSFVCDFNGYKISGRIDRIDQIGDEYELIDYKTGKKFGKKKAYDELQLPVYFLGAKEALNIEASLLSYYFVMDGEKLAVSVDKEIIEKSKASILSIIDEIEKGIFEPREDYLNCKSCSYDILCPAKEKDF